MEGYRYVRIDEKAGNIVDRHSYRRTERNNREREREFLHREFAYIDGCETSEV